MVKTLDQNFIDWEANYFGLGYGTGEPHTLTALKTFFATIKELDRGTFPYDYRKLEVALRPAVVWLLITILVRADVIDYGTSPRFGWLSPEGQRLKEFFATKTIGELVDLTAADSDYIHCYPGVCNCGSGGYVCNNPFWKVRTNG